MGVYVKIELYLNLCLIISKLFFIFRYIMDTWTRQMGYPVLTVKPGDETNTYVITQSRFLLDSEAVYENDSPYK